MSSTTSRQAGAARSPIQNAAKREGFGGFFRRFSDAFLGVDLRGKTDFDRITALVGLLKEKEREGKTANVHFEIRVVDEDQSSRRHFEFVAILYRVKDVKSIVKSVRGMRRAEDGVFVLYGAKSHLNVRVYKISEESGGEESWVLNLVLRGALSIAEKTALVHMGVSNSSST